MAVDPLPRRTALPSAPARPVPGHRGPARGGAVGGWRARWRAAARRVDAATPEHRDRSVDALRAFAILGVVLGH